MRVAESFSAYSSFAGSSARHVQTAPPFSQALEARSRTGVPQQIPSSLASSLWIPKDGSPSTQRRDSAVVSEFLGFSTMTLDQWIRAQILQKRNLTEESLATLPVSEKETVEREIAEAIKQALTGISDQDGPDEAAAKAQPSGDKIKKSPSDMRST